MTELKVGKTVYVTKENPNIQNTPTSGKVHAIGKNHVTIRTLGGTGYYKVHKDNISHDSKDNWLSRKYRTEEAPAMSAGSGAIAGIGIGPKGEPGVKPDVMKRYKDKNKSEAPKSGRKSFAMFIQGR